MTTDAHDAVLKDLRTLFDQGVFANLTDGQLLERFVSRDGELSEAAFGVLVERHGPMVLRVCRNVLKDPHDVEDAFQATFLILVRKAGSIRKRASCGSWLHGVALRASAKIRTAAARRREHERRHAQDAADRTITPAPELPDDLPGLIDEELARLLDHHRSPLVLCYLEGHTCEEAARQLGWPVGTVKSRLARARERLRRRLTRRGVSPVLVPVAGIDLPSPVKVTVPASLETRVLQESVRFAARGAAVAALPSTIAALVRAEIRRGYLARTVRAGMVLLGIGAALTAAVPKTPNTEEDPPPRAAPPERPKAKPSPIHVRVIDLQGKPVEGADVLAFQRSGSVLKLKTDRDGRIVLPPLRAIDWFSLMARGGGGLVGETHYGNTPIRGGTAEKPMQLTLTPVTHQVAGSIADAQGRPIAGVRVAGRGLYLEESNFILSGRQIEQQGYPLGSCVTDASGRFTLTLPIGRDVLLAFLHPRWVSPWIVIPGDAEVVETVTLHQAGRITGEVNDTSTGAPIAGARVYAQFLDSPSETFGSVGEAVSDIQGRFTMGALEEGVYNLTLSDVPGRNRATARAVAGIRVRAGEDSVAHLEVLDGTPLQGVVIDPTTMQPVPDVMVNCWGAVHRTWGQPLDVDISEERGEFRFFVPPGVYEVSVFASPSLGRASRLGRAYVSVPEGGKVAPIRLVAPGPERLPPVIPKMAPTAMVKMGPMATVRTAPTGTTTETKTTRAPIRRPPSPPEGREGRTVTGRVRDPEGRPLVGVKIAARVSSKLTIKAPGKVNEKGFFVETSFRTVTTVASDREGVFIAEGLPPGEVTMIATHPESARRGDSLTQIVPGDRGTVDFTFGRLPGDGPPDPDLPATAIDEPLPPALRDRLTFVNIASKANEFLADGPGDRGDDLNRLIQGVRAFDGVFYRIGERLIHLRAQAMPAVTDRASAIAVGVRADRVRILHAARGDVPQGSEVGVYTVRYTDGTFERIPALFGRDLGGWFSSTLQPPVVPTRARVAWSGTNDFTDSRKGLRLRIHLFTFTWNNPHPQRVIASIDAVSTNREGELVLVGITLERDAPR